jgi:hypothetical protein
MRPWLDTASVRYQTVPPNARMKTGHAVGIFSSGKPLSAQFQEAVDPCFTEATVGRKHFRLGISKLEASQDGIVSAMTVGETLINIAPSVTDGMGYSGQLILTNKRILEYKRKVCTSIPIDEVVDVKLGAHPGGYVVISIISATARNYAEFSNSPESNAGLKYWENIIQLYLGDPQLARHAAALIRGEAERTQT